MRSLFILFTVYSLINFLPAQIADSIQVVAHTDSIAEIMNLLSDSMKTDSIKLTQQKAVNVTYNQLWQQFKLEGGIKKNTNSKIYHHFDNLIIINYTGLADIFRHQPTFQVYDFMSPGYPRFIAFNNLLPHQSDIYLNGFILNDPMHGMFNTHMISLDGLKEVNDDIDLTMYGHGNGINLRTKAINSLDEPYSRIMFRQGDFGYTDLDIDFSRKLSDNISVNAGGINKIYEGTSRYGFQYRAGVYYKITNNLFSRTTINIDREKVPYRNLINYPDYRYFEFRQDYNNSIYYIINPDSSEFWKLDFGYTRIRRKNEASDDSASAFFNRRRVDQYKIGFNRNIHLGVLKLNAAFSAYQNKFWGSSFSGKLTDGGMNGLVQIKYSMNKWLSIDGKINTGYLYGQDISWSSALDLNFEFNNFWLKLSTSQSRRFPYRNERSIYFQQYRGNSDLDLETLETYSADIEYTPINNLHVNVKIASNKISDEILMDSTSFYNGPNRHFNYIELSTQYALYKFSLELTGNLGDAKINLSPKRSFSGQLRYHDTWLKGAVIIDAVGSFHWYDVHNTLYYNPIVERIYWDQTETDGYHYFSYKIAATVKSAQLYMAMDNPMSYKYQYINGYNEYYRRVRFGVNWVLMD
jgi:hypothetical protein